MRVERADRRLGLRLTVAAAATVALGIPFLLLALLVRGDWGPLVRVDTAVARDLNEVAHGSEPLVVALKTASIVFGPEVFRVAAVLVAIWLFTRRRRRLAARTLVTSLVGGLLGPVLKAIVGRARPALDDPVAHAGGLSFPSGHALGSVVGVGVLLLVLGPLLTVRRRRTAWVAGVLVVLLVGFARVGLGVHYLSDVVAGWVLGVAWLGLTSAAFEGWRRDVDRPPSPVAQAEPEVAEDLPERRAGRKESSRGRPAGAGQADWSCADASGDQPAATPGRPRRLHR